MPGYDEREGAKLRDLRNAILASFDWSRLDQFLKDHDLFSHEIATSPNFEARVASLIDIAKRNGWLIKLCRALESVPKDSQAHSAIVSVRKWLILRDPRKLTVVLSSVGLDREWTDSFRAKAGFFEALDPCSDPIDTLERQMQSKNSASVEREIDDARLFVGIVSKRYIEHEDSIKQLNRALDRLSPGPDRRPPARRVLALALDQKSRDWLTERQNNLDSACRPCLEVEELFEGERRKSIIPNGVIDDDVVGQISSAGRRLRAFFDEPRDEGPPALPPSPPRSPSIIILGEPTKETPAPTASLANDELARALANRNVPYDRWADGWRATSRPISEVSHRPVFVRTILDESSVSDAAKDLSYRLNRVFGFEHDDVSENVRSLIECPKVLWRPKGPDWKPGAEGPLLYSRIDPPSDFGRFLETLFGKVVPASAWVYYEDDLENAKRRVAVENCLISAVTTEEPPLYPDSVAFGPGKVIEVIDRVRDGALTVIAAHDLSTTKSREATIERFREIDRRIDQTLARKRAENAPLMRVAVLLRNADQFGEETEFSRQSRVRHWGMLKIRQRDDGTYEPDPNNVVRLRMDVADLAQRRPELRAP